MWDGLDKKTGNRVLRGGIWSYDVGNARSEDRYSRTPAAATSNCGFRLARGRP